MKLTREEKHWLEDYRQALAQQFPGLVEQVVIFGSKARETATADSDLDILVVIRKGDWRLKDLNQDARDWDTSFGFSVGATLCGCPGGGRPRGAAPTQTVTTESVPMS